MNHNREEPFVLSDRPTQQQLPLQIDVGDDIDELTNVKELHRSQSASANTKQPSLAAIRRSIRSYRSETATERKLEQRGPASLDQLQLDLMEKIVDTDNMVEAWTKVRRNAGRLSAVDLELTLRCSHTAERKLEVKWRMPPRPRRNYGGRISRMARTALARNATTTSGWHLSPGIRSAKVYPQTGWQRTPPSEVS